MMIRIVVKTGSLVSCKARMKQLGVSVSDDVGESGKATQLEAFFERGNTPFEVDVHGDTFFTILLTPDQADKLPKVNTPNYEIVWDSRETEQVGEVDGEPIMARFPRPEYETVNYDADSNPDGTRMQMVGWI